MDNRRLALSMAASTAVLLSQGALDNAHAPVKPDLSEIPQVPADAKATWRGRKDVVDVAFAGKVAPALSRQEARALKRRIAKLEASEARGNARTEARLERKAKQAGLRK